MPPLLFDTGDNGDSLLYNMKELGIDPAGIGIIFISHRHHDHTGGLSAVLAESRNAVVYSPVSSSLLVPDREVVKVSRPVSISETVFSTGELKGIEQALGVKTDRGIVVITGCSHPGVGEILAAAADYGDIFGIIGGFHGFRDFSRLNGLSFISPCHCTQHTAELSRLFPDQYIACGAGLELEI